MCQIKSHSRNFKYWYFGLNENASYHSWRAVVKAGLKGNF